VKRAIATFPTKVEAGTVFVQVGGANAAGELTYDEDDGAACADDGACDQGGGKGNGNGKGKGKKPIRLAYDDGPSAGSKKTK
jgi:hypothetical protein